MSRELPQRLGPYTLLRHLASGGMGEVYLAHAHFDAGERLCVVKTVRPEFARDRLALRRFVDEARTSALLSHANVVTVLDVGEATGTAFIVVEYVLGRDLMALMARASRVGRAIPEAVALFIVTELLEALDYVHRAVHPRTGEPLHVVHRDISPHNLLVSDGGAVKLIDFGIARSAVKSDQTQVGMLVGKVRYMSPEQARGEAVDGATDVWAACVIACELLTGRRFWGGRGPEAVAPMLAAGIPHRAPGFSALAPELQRWLERGLDPERARRPSAAELREGLRAVQARRRTLGSAAEVAALMEALFAAEIAGEREACEQVLQEPTAASVAAWPEHTAYEEYLDPVDDETATRTGDATRSMTPVAPHDATRRARPGRGGRAAPARSSARPRVALLIAAAAGAAVAAATVAGMFAADAVEEKPRPRVELLPEPRIPEPPEPVLPPAPVPTPTSAAPVEPVAPAPTAPGALPAERAPPAPVLVPTPTSAPPEAMPAPERRPAKRPSKPSAIPLLFSDRVEALRACAPRPACASGVLRRADGVADLDVEELRDLDDALARCLARCGR
ncbi:MAG: protein kinase [Deltaproteobacteria bacterium]|nr:protein kinase [Deltaproteobacteria bacterium]